MNIFRFAIPVFLLLTSCTSSEPEPKSINFKSEVKAFCEVYNPHHWKDYPKDFNISQLYMEIGDRISKTIESEEFRAIFLDFNKQREQDFYHFVKRRVSDLQGEPFTCQYYEDFYNAISTSESSDTNQITPEEINVVFDEQGSLSINGSEIATPNTDTLKTELARYIKDKSEKIIIHKNIRTTDEALTPIFDAVAALGITRLSIVEPENQQ